MEFARNQAKQKVDQIERQKKSDAENITNLISRRKFKEDKVKQLRESWDKVSAETITFDVTQFACPTCKREFAAEVIDSKRTQLTKNFEDDKTRRLSDITAEGKTVAASISEINSQIAEIESADYGTVVIPETATLPAPDPTTLPEYVKIQAEIDTLSLQVLEAPKIDVSGLQQQKSELQSEIDTLNRQLTINEQNERANIRVSELMGEESSLAQQIADLEKSEYAIDGYNRSKMDMVESRVNSKFKMVAWRMFTTNLNGGQEDDCTCLIKGVPYTDANNAARIQAGIDIISTLNDHYGVYAPVFTDNAEAVNDLPIIKSQMVRLIVTRDPQLIIKS
jgi:hypothetical protein